MGQGFLRGNSRPFHLEPGIQNCIMTTLPDNVHDRAGLLVILVTSRPEKPVLSDEPMCFVIASMVPTAFVFTVEFPGLFPQAYEVNLRVILLS